MAAARDAAMLAEKMAGTQRVSMDFPPLKGGLFDTTAGAGGLLPQVWSEAGRLDDMLGSRFWLIARALPSDLQSPTGVVAAALDDPRLTGFRGGIAQYLDTVGAEALLVRPDRHIFGTGAPAALLDRLAALGGPGAA